MSVDRDRDGLDGLLRGLRVAGGCVPRRDLTPSIMASLGFMHVAPAVARRRRRRRMAGRVLTAASVLIAAGLAFRMHAVIVGTRQPAGPTIDQALREEVVRHRSMFDGAASTIRSLLPAGKVLGNAGAPAGIAPSDAGHADEPPGWQNLPEDLDRSGIGPFRWL